MLDERKRLVLRAVINDYIESAEPVGSRTIAKKHHLGVSPATIRNEMADLEETGYLEQPHVSAGRIPSDKGYRFYVDVLMEPQKLSKEESSKVQKEVVPHKKEMEPLIHHTANLLAMLTKSIAVVVAPQVQFYTLRHLQLVPIDDHTVLVVLVLDPSMVKNAVVPTLRPYVALELSKISLVLNEKLKGISYRDLGRSLVEEIVELYGPLAKTLFEVIRQALYEEQEVPITLNGTLYILDQPEFKDVERLKSFFRMLDNKRVLKNLLADVPKGSGVVAQIGKENKEQDVQDCSVVAAAYSVGGDTLGSIGVIGPTRMEYSRVFAVVEFVASYLSETLTRLVK